MFEGVEEKVPEKTRSREELGLERLATSYALAIQSERIVRLKKDVFQLEERLEEEQEKVLASPARSTGSRPQALRHPPTTSP